MQRSNPVSEAPKATSREWIGLAVLALPCLIYSMDLTVLNLAAPQLAAELRPSAAQLLWIMDIYGFLLAGSLITMGTLGDRIGRRRLLLIGAAAFGAASVLAAFSTSAEMLIASRALLGVAAATLAPSTLSLIRNMFLDSKQRTLAIGVWIASFSAGAAIGPLIGGVMLAHFWWGSVFLLNVPIMLLLLGLGPFLLPEFRDPKAGRLDMTSAALSLAAVLAVIYGVKKIAESGAAWPGALSILSGLAAGAVFLRRQAKLADPLIDLSLFRMPAFSAALAANILALFIVSGFFLFIAQYLQLVLEMGPFEAGLWTAPSGIALAAGSLLTPFIARRIHPAAFVACGFAVSALGFLMLTQAGGDERFWLLIGGFVLLCLGLAPVGTLTTDMIVGLAPPERAGAASAISETSFEFGAALGIAVLGSLVNAIYRGEMTGAANAGFSAETLAAARDTLASAVEAARALPGDSAARLVSAARDAFVQAFEWTAAICALIAACTAILVSALLRDVKGGTEPPRQPVAGA